MEFGNKRQDSKCINRTPGPEQDPLRLTSTVTSNGSGSRAESAETGVASGADTGRTPGIDGTAGSCGVGCREGTKHVVHFVHFNPWQPCMQRCRKYPMTAAHWRCPVPERQTGDQSPGGRISKCRSPGSSLS